MIRGAASLEPHATSGSGIEEITGLFSEEVYNPPPIWAPGPPLC